MALAIPFVEVVLVLVAMFLSFHLLKKNRDPRFPPGPSFALPILGNILQLGSQPQKVFQKWAEQYGDVVSFKMGSNDVIMLNESKMIKDVFAEASSAGRTPNPIFMALTNGNYGTVTMHDCIIIGEGKHWEQQRRFTLRTLRDLGFAKTAMEGIILEEIKILCEYFEKRLDKPITGNRLFNGPVVNALWYIMSGERQNWDGPTTPPIIKHGDDLVEAINQTKSSGLMFAPSLRHVAPDHFGWTKWIASVAGVNSICNKSISRHVSNLDPDSPQDLIDHYLNHMNKTTDPSSSFYKQLGARNLAAIIPDLFLAGSQTTSNALSWLTIHLAHNQRVLKKLQKELDTIVGPGRQPSITDKPNLPYTEATIMEILRRCSLLSDGVPHRMVEDAVINGYFFPKNATIISNIFWVQNNPKIWGDPENFRPERFLSEDGSKVIRHDAFIPFSTGKRVCLGESLARDTMFLFLVCIAQKFDIKPAPGSNRESELNVEPKGKFLNEPEPFQMVINLREQ